MDRRGEFEIVINARTFERTVFVLVILILAALLVWRWSFARTTEDTALAQNASVLMEQLATANAQIASLQAQLVQRDATIANLTAKSLVAPPPSTGTSAPPAPTGDGSLSANWTVTGTSESKTTWRLQNIALAVHNGKEKSVPVSWSVCWYSLDCTRVFSEGVFSAEPGNSSTNLGITLPTLVSVSGKGQSLRMTVDSGNTNLIDDIQYVPN